MKVSSKLSIIDCQFIIFFMVSEHINSHEYTIQKNMTTSSSKYAYPANLNVANFVSLKLTSTNFLLWETQVLSLIESQDLIGFITGSTSAPTAEISNPTNDGTMPNPDLATWTHTDRLVKEWITTTISEEALGTVVGLTTSLDV